jgi:hypothetical protein
MTARSEWLAHVFPELADTLVDDFDVVEFLSMVVDRTAELLDASEVGLVLVDQHGALRVMASSTERMLDIELFELQADEGPFQDAVQTGEQILNIDLEAADDRWPQFSPRARAVGFRTAHALPMRLRDQRIGAVNIFSTERQVIDPIDVSIAQAFADVATIGILQERAQRREADLIEQLQHALNSRVTIEQAKGVAAGQLGIGTDEAFALLRSYARSRSLRLAHVAADITSYRLPATALRARPPSGIAPTDRDLSP